MSHFLFQVALSQEDIETILDTLIFDGKVERTVVAGAGGDGDHVKLYRAVVSLVPTTGLMRVPCGMCPVSIKHGLLINCQIVSLLSMFTVRKICCRSHGPAAQKSCWSTAKADGPCIGLSNIVIHRDCLSVKLHGITACPGLMDAKKLLVLWQWDTVCS